MAKHPFKKAWSDFFTSVKESIKNLFTSHILKVIGFVVSFFVPTIYMLVLCFQAKPKSWSVPTFVWIPLIVFIFIYWMKLRGYLNTKIHDMKKENEKEKGKFAIAIILGDTLKVIMVVVPLLLLAWVFHWLSEVAVKISHLFILLGVCEAVGGLLTVIDTISHVVDFTDEEESEESEEE